MPTANALPLYVQITELLIRDIAAGRLLDGEKLPPERDLATSLGIAVGTLRQALKELTAKGMLVRVQGSGNYIRAKAGVDSVYALLRIELATGGGLPTARVQSVDHLPKDPSLPPFGSAPMAHRIRRLRYLSGVVAAVEEIWLDASYAPSIRIEDLSDSLYLYYRKTLRLWITRAEDSIGQGPLPIWAPPEFPHAPGMPLPQITRISYDQEGRAAEASWTWYDPQKVRYIARLK